MKLTVLDPKDPILRQATKPVSEKELKSPEIQQLIKAMLEFVYGSNKKGVRRNRFRLNTVGLSANQVGISKQICVVDLGIGHKSYSDVHALINPQITWSSKQSLERCEGCVNLPTIWGYVKRSQRVKVKSLDRSGNKIQLDLTGWPAILLQHEVGHLNGSLFIDKLSDPKKAHLVKDTELKEHKKLKRNWPHYIDVTDLVQKS